MKLKVCVAGATGWIGKPLCSAIARDAGLELVGAVARTQSGRLLKEITGDESLNVRVSDGRIHATVIDTQALEEK